MAMGMQFILLGVGDPHLEDAFRRLMQNSRSGFGENRVQ